MPKIKTRKSALKRFGKSVTGKFMRRKAYKGHLLEKKTSKLKANLSRKMVVFKGDAIALRSMIPYA